MSGMAEIQTGTKSTEAPKVSVIAVVTDLEGIRKYL